MKILKLIYLTSVVLAARRSSYSLGDINQTQNFKSLKLLDIKYHQQLFFTYSKIKISHIFFGTIFFLYLNFIPKKSSPAMLQRLDNRWRHRREFQRKLQKRRRFHKWQVNIKKTLKFEYNIKYQNLLYKRDGRRPTRFSGLV